MKRLYYFTSIILSVIMFVSCSSNDKNIIKEQNNTEVVNYTSFKALNNEYFEGQDIGTLQVGTMVYNVKEDKPYINGEYKEIDFAIDLIEQYLVGDERIYDISISNENKNRLIESLASLKNQMGLSVEEPIYFRVSSVVYNGKILNEKNTANLIIKGQISVNDTYFASLIEFSVNVKSVDGQLYGDIE